FNLLPLLAPLIVLLLSLLALKAGTPSLSAALVASLLGVGMIFTGLVGSAAMHLDALGLVGTVFGEAALVYVVYGAVLAAIGGFTRLHFAGALGDQRDCGGYTDERCEHDAERDSADGQSLDEDDVGDEIDGRKPAETEEEFGSDLEHGVTSARRRRTTRQ
ncbi:MAG: hypothetical protein ACKOJH_00950, partial [Actinomycetota bacterium]